MILEDNKDHIFIRQKFGGQIKCFDCCCYGSSGVYPMCDKCGTSMHVILSIHGTHKGYCSLCEEYTFSELDDYKIFWSQLTPVKKKEDASIKLNEPTKKYEITLKDLDKAYKGFEDAWPAIGAALQGIQSGTAGWISIDSMKNL